MDLIEFKEKYFTNNFYWINKENYKIIQEIGLDVGCLLFTKEKDIIEYHKGFKNLGFRTYDRNNCITFFQKESFLLSNEKPTNFDEMLINYNKLKIVC